MKRLMLVVLFVLTGALLCACKKDDREETVSATPTVTEEPDKVVSGEAVSPTEKPQYSDTEAFELAEDYVKEMTLEEKIGQMFLVDLDELDSSRTLDGYRFSMTENMKEAIQKYHIGGVYLTTANVGNQEQTSELISDLQECVSGGALYVAAEEDGGGEHSLSAQTADFQDTGFVTPAQMGKSMNASQIYETGRTIAKGLTKVGFNLNLAPVADVGISERCFGETSEEVSEIVPQMIAGQQEGGLAVTMRHFPAMGDSEEILSVTESLMSLRSERFTPYAAGIEAGADCVMVSNVSVDKVTIDKIPAFLSGDIVTTLLREELGFEGVVMSWPLHDNVVTTRYTPDFAAVEAVKAGCDMIVLPADLERSYKALLGAVKSGKIDEKVINTAVARILKNKIQRHIIIVEE